MKLYNLKKDLNSAIEKANKELVSAAKDFNLFYLNVKNKVEYLNGQEKFKTVEEGDTVNNSFLLTSEFIKTFLHKDLVIDWITLEISEGFVSLHIRQVGDNGVNKIVAIIEIHVFYVPI